MNANELADALVNTDYTPLKAECAAMLRQQQEKITKYELRNIAQCDRIAILEAQLKREKEMNKQEKIKELEYLNNEHRGVIGILMDEREVLRAEIEKLKSEVGLYRTDAEKLTLRLVDCVVNHSVKELAKNIAGVWRMSDQSIQIVFTSCRSASEFIAILRKAQTK